MPERNDKRHNERWLAQRLACAAAFLDGMAEGDKMESLFSPILKDFYDNRASQAGFTIRLLLGQWLEGSVEDILIKDLMNTVAYENALINIRHSLYGSKSEVA